MHEPLVILDDDPTGAQAVADSPVAMAWADGEIRAAWRPGDRAIHVLTNSRAHTAAAAQERVEDAARAAVRDLESPRIVLRGDSTLRGHVWEEYEAVRRVLAPGAHPPLLLVPALPSAGRVTRGGVHMLVRDGRAVPLDATEYATDGAFAYSDARLIAWAEERSGGRLRASDGLEPEPDGVLPALRAATRCGRPAVVAPDADTDGDLETIARAVEQAWTADIPIVVRCAPAFAAILAGTSARSLVAPPPATRLLLICGSFVPMTTAQLATVDERRPGVGVRVDVEALAADRSAAEAELIRSARLANQALAAHGCAVVSTTRERLQTLVAPDAQHELAARLASLVGLIEPAADLVVAKGGITSAIVATHGLGARTARVVGPVLPGVSHWQVDGRAGPGNVIVVPGNVGGPSLLADLLDLLLPAREIAPTC